MRKEIVDAIDNNEGFEFRIKQMNDTIAANLELSERLTKERAELTKR